MHGPHGQRRFRKWLALQHHPSGKPGGDPHEPMKEDVDAEREAKEEIGELQTADAPENFPTLFGGNCHGLCHESPLIVSYCRMNRSRPTNFTSWAGIGNRLRPPLSGRSVHTRGLI